MRRSPLRKHRRKDRRPKTKRARAPAKISMPHLNEVYKRARLFRTLDAAVRKRVVWIGAPAGAGKTSVVSTYLAARARCSLWYNIDARDADVANLFHYLAMAAGIAAPRRRRALPVFAAE